MKLVDCKYRGVIDKCTPHGQFLSGCDRRFLDALLMRLQVPLSTRARGVVWTTIQSLAHLRECSLGGNVQ